MIRSIVICFKDSMSKQSKRRLDSFLGPMTFSIKTLILIQHDTQHNSIECHYAECYYAECRDYLNVMLSVRLIVLMLSAVAP